MRSGSSHSIAHEREQEHAYFIALYACTMENQFNANISIRGDSMIRTEFGIGSDSSLGMSKVM